MNLKTEATRATKEYFAPLGWLMEKLVNLFGLTLKGRK